MFKVTESFVSFPSLDSLLEIPSRIEDFGCWQFPSVRPHSATFFLVFINF
jgi:hypothetical protein